jgi:hypothetical protein
MKKQPKKVTPKKEVFGAAPKKTVKKTLFINPDGTISSSYADAISWDREKPN